MRVILLTALCASASLCLAADPVLRPGVPALDRATLTSIGVILPVTGDENYNGSVTLRFRRSGTEQWLQGMPLFRVRPETVVSTFPLQPHFAGSILDLRPGTTYEIELNATDPDGTSQTFKLSATTRPVPGYPANPRTVNVNSAAAFAGALAAARPGDVITLADGVYEGAFYITRAGTASDPIVIRGSSVSGTILDGRACTGCNVLEVYGAGYVQIENLSIRNAQRAIRFQTAGAIGNVVRRVSISNTAMGIGGKPDQQDFYIADNILTGRLAWPVTFTSDGGAHADDDGIAVVGSGHVIAHNRISGYGDAIRNHQRGYRAVDVYGNDVLFTYDNGIELDGAAGNVRALRNRFTNTFSPISVQPVLAGPAYVIRNIAVNTQDEQIKSHIHATVPPEEPNGVLVYNNTFVSPYLALSMQGSGTSHHMKFQNNLFIGPAVTSYGYTVDWYGKTNNIVFDWNGYFPDGRFAMGSTPLAGNFAQYQQYREGNGRLLSGNLFRSGLVAPSSHIPRMEPQNVSLAANSPAVDRGLAIPNVTDMYSGSAPDLGAQELDCPVPLYGPRPDGVDENTPPPACAPVPDKTPASISIVSGSGQTARVGTSFAFPLTVVVRNAAGTPLQDIAITFRAPSAGASGTFGSTGTSVTVSTNSAGQAVSPIFTANNSSGRYEVQATAGTAPPVAFHLTNVAGSAVSVKDIRLTYSTAPQPVSLFATVTLSGAVVTSGTVDFHVDGAFAGRAPVDSGKAQVGWTVPGGTPATKVMQIVATFSGTSIASAASGNATITLTRKPSTLRWSQPASIVQGTALSATQLNATADVPGTFRYTPSAGTILQAGPGQKLTAVFVPVDEGNYTSETASVTIDVTPATAPAPAATRPASLALSAVNVVRDTANRRTVVTLRISNAGDLSSGPVRVLWAIAANSRAVNMPLSLTSIDGLQSRTIELHLPLEARRGATTALLGVFSGSSVELKSAPVTIP